jgi:hypothetical protein
MKSGTQPSFLLDTSAFIALPTRRLEEASRSASLYVSPFCFWELLTHLEDDGKFSRVKGTLMKFRHVAVRDDPQAEVYRFVLPSSDSVHTRVRDGDLVYAALAALDDSESTKEFYKRDIQDESGQRRQIAGCVAAIRQLLRIEENKFQAFLRAVAAEVRAGNVRLLEASDYDHAVQALSRGSWLKIGDRANGAPVVYEQFVRKTYMYHSYVIHRAREYAASSTAIIDPEPNDFEDARLCLHLGLDDFTAVVTNDAALRRCIGAGLGALNATADAAHHTPLQVWDTAAMP